MFPANPVMTFSTIFAAGALAGLAATLRSNHPLTWRSAAAALLNGGFISLGIFLAAAAYVPDYPCRVAAICVFASLGGMTVTRVLLYAFRQGGVNIEVKVPPPDKEDDDAC